MRCHLLLVGILLIAISLIAVPPAHGAAAPGTVLWAQAPLGTGALTDSWDFARTGPDGSLYVAGYRGRSPTVAFSGSVGVGRYAADGSSMWSHVWSGSMGLAFFPTAITVDRHGNLYVLVQVMYHQPPEYESDIVVLKYSAGGQLRWSHWIGAVGESSDGAVAIEVSATGNVYICATQTHPDTAWDIAVFKLTPNGDLRYRTAYRGPSADMAADLALDDKENAYVSGTTSVAGGGHQALLMKVAPDGSRGWVRRLDRDPSYSAAVQARDGAVYMAGQSGSPDYVFCAKYSGAGARQWLRTWASGDGSQWVDGLAVDSQGGAYVIGHAVPGSPPPYPPTFLVKWSSGGSLLWKRVGLSLYAPLGASLSSILVGSGDRVYVGGSVYDPGSGDVDVLVSRYTTLGRRLWTTRWDGPDHRGDRCLALASGRRPNGAPVLYATGWSHGGGSTAEDLLALRLQP